MTKIIQVSDPHFSDKRPVSRKDNFLETQINKIRFVFSVARKDSVDAIVIAGDLCHNPVGRNIRRELDVTIIKEFLTSPCPILFICGNHDIEHGRIESTVNHPVGVLQSANLIKSVSWPDYVVVGEDSPVLVIGKDYCVDGPLLWLRELRDSEVIKNLKEKTGCSFCMCLTHCYWGVETGDVYGDPVVGHREIEETYIDVMGHGHNHDRTGVVSVGEQTIVGPGALIRGTLAETDTLRTPAIALIQFDHFQKPVVDLIDVPCADSRVIFDLSRHERIKRHRKIIERFTDSVLRAEKQENSNTDLDTVIGEIEKRASRNVVLKVKEYVERAIQSDRLVESVPVTTSRFAEDLF